MNKYIKQANSVINGRNNCPEDIIENYNCDGCFFYEFYSDVNDDGKRLYGCAFDEIMLEKANDFLNKVRTKKLERIIDEK